MLKALLLEDEIRKSSEGADVRLRFAWLGPEVYGEAARELALATAFGEWAEERLKMLKEAH
jgi:hypothetical protein